MIRRSQFLHSLFLPLVARGEPAQQQPVAAIFLAVPPFVNGLNLTNPQLYMDRAGVIFAATRADSSIGGIVWRVDGYVDRDHPGVSTQINPTDPTKFFANGELAIWPDGFLYYISVEINNLQQRVVLAQVAYPVPGWVR